MATPAPRNFRHKLKFDKSLFRGSRGCFSSGFETEEGCYICWCWTGTICDQTLFSSVSACLTRFGHRWCLFFLGRREPYLQTKEVILPKPTLLTPWAYWNYLREHGRPQGSCITKKGHISMGGDSWKLYPNIPCPMCRQVHWPLF